MLEDFTIDYMLVPTPIDTTVAACESFAWGDSVYTASGVYTRMRRVHGFPVTDTLRLTIHPSTTGVDVVDACERYTWIDGQTYIASTSLPTYTITNAAGCDSTVTLNLTIHYPSTGTDVVRACDRYTWINGITYTASSYGSTYTYTNVYGCDSTVTLDLTIRQSTAGTETVTACDSYTWQGITYTTSTVVHGSTTLQNSVGCDSTVTLDLTINYSSTGTETITACDRFTWHDSTYTESGIFNSQFSILNSQGCDSTVTLHLTVNRSTTGTDTWTACDRYTWIDGVIYTASTTTPTYTLTNAEDCDSVVSLDLTINYSVVSEVYDTACESYVWTDYLVSSRTYDESGDYSFTTTSMAGCDSTVTLHLTIHHGTHDNYYQHACDTFTWHGTEYTLTGTYLYEYTNADGCASVDTLHLTVDQHSDTSYHVTLCDSVYRWNDSVYTESGIYIYDYSLTGSTCTNVDTLYLTLNRPAYTDIWDTACNSYSWGGTIIPEGDWYHESGTYTRNLQTIHGCDSVATLHLTIHHSSTLDTTLVACDTLFWTVDDTTFVITESGDYIVGFGYYTQDLDPPYPLSLTQPFTNAEGCDSTQELHVTIRHSSTGVDVVNACDSLTWIDGVTYYTSTYNAQFSTLNAEGCDSLVTLNLTLRHSTAATDTITACDSYTWMDGVTYTTSTTGPTVTLVNASGCDSVVTLNLTLNRGSYTATYQAACDSFLWHDSLYTLSGTYVYDYLSPEGCASADTLILTLSNGTSTGYHVDACDGYIWNGQRYTETGNYIYDYSMLGGDCQNVDTLYLTIHHSYSLVYYDTACDSYTWSPNEVFTRSGTYYHSLTTAYGCDSLETLYLTLHYNTSTAYFDTIDEGDIYTWPVNGERYTTEGTYYYDYLSPDGCSSTDTLYLYVHHDTPVYYTLHARVSDTVMGYVIVYPDSVAMEGSVVYVIPVPHEGYRFVSWDNGDTNIIQAVLLMSDTSFTAVFERVLGVPKVDGLADLTVYPNPTTGVVTLSADNVTRVEVYDNRGRRLYAVDNSATVDLTSLPTGVYMLRITTPQGSAVRRVMKR